MSAETAANEKAGWWVAGIMGGGGGRGRGWGEGSALVSLPNLEQR